MFLRFTSAFFKKSISAVIVFIVTAPVVVYFALLHDNEGFFDALRFVFPLAILATLLGMSAGVRNLARQTSFSFISLALLMGVILVPWRLTIQPAGASDPMFFGACEWIKMNTAKSDLFLTEPFSSRGGDIRLFCGRGLFATRKDGGQVVFSREYALEWNRRYDIIKKLQSDYSQESVTEISKEYGIDYLLSDNELDLSGKVFDNQSFYVYKLR